MSKTIDAILKHARQQPLKVVLSEWDDPRIHEALTLAKQTLPNVDLKLIVPINGRLDSEFDDNIHRIVPDSDEARLLAHKLMRRRAHKAMTLDEANQAILDPLMYASLLVEGNYAQGTVNGCARTSADVIRTYIHALGPDSEVQIVSSYFLMILNPASDHERAVVFSDCALVVDPTAQELADIGLASAHSFQELTGQIPQIAFLGFDTHGSAVHPKMEKVMNAVSLAKRRSPTFTIDGALQFDAAFVPEICKRKAPRSPIGGNANVFIFPDLNSGNIGYKIAERIGGAVALGPLLQGLTKPAHDLSRGSNARDILTTIAITAIQAQSIQAQH